MSISNSFTPQNSSVWIKYDSEIIQFENYNIDKNWIEKINGKIETGISADGKLISWYSSPQELDIEFYFIQKSPTLSILENIFEIQKITRSPLLISEMTIVVPSENKIFLCTGGYLVGRSLTPAKFTWDKIVATKIY